MNMNYCNGEENTASTMCNPCPYDGNCQECREDMEQDEKVVIPWEHLWDAPDYTFKGRCKNCGFIHYFIQGHDAQYRFCPQCGEQKVI